MPSSLAERRSLSQAPIAASAVVTAQDIIAGGGVYEVDFVTAQSVVLYVGFPVVVQLDDSELSVPKLLVKRGAGGETYTFTTSGHYRIARPVRRLRFLPPAGFGAGGEAEMYGRHGSILIFAGNPDIEPLAVNPDMLPSHVARFSITLGATTTNINTTIADTVWNVGNATPSVIWLKWISVGRQLAATGVPTGLLYDVALAKNNSPVGDLEYFWAAHFASTIMTTFPLPNLEVTLKSCFDAYGAAAGDIAISAVYDSNASATGLFFDVGYSYLL